MLNRTTAFLATAAVLLVVALSLSPRLPVRAEPRPIAPRLEAQGPISQTSGPLMMQATLSHPYVSPDGAKVTAAIDLTAVRLGEARRTTPLNLALVIDRSGSMAGEKIYQAKRAASELLGRLSDFDRIAIVHYGSDVRVFTSTQATPGARAAMQRFIDSITEEGGTNIEAGLNAGRLELARHFTPNGINRLILMSDGQPTEGATEPNALLQVVRTMHRSGISVSAIGVGLDFNEDLMARFANVGAGGYAFLSDPARMGEVFEKDFDRASRTIARRVALRIRRAPGVAADWVSPVATAAVEGDLVVELPDFAEGETQRVLVTWRVAPGAVGAQLGLGNVEISGQGAGALATSSVNLNYQPWTRVSDDSSLVSKSVNAEIAVAAARAMQALELEQAATALQNGNLDESRRYLARGKAAFSEAARIAGPAAVQRDLDTLSDTEAEFSRAHESGDTNFATKKAKSSARIGAGLGTSTY